MLWVKFLTCAASQLLLIDAREPPVVGSERATMAGGRLISLCGRVMCLKTSSGWGCQGLHGPHHSRRGVGSRSELLNLLGDVKARVQDSAEHLSHGQSP